MAGLEGNINTPLGPMSKKTAVIGGSVLVIVMAVAYYRYRKQQAASATAAAGSSIGTDPATGYLYGSAEDAAALNNQGSYLFPSGSGGGGGNGSGVNNPGTGFVSNAQWSQAAIQYMQAQGLIVDATQLSAALGAYLTGSPVTSDQKSLIEQAIAIQGYPPVSGSNGYPPSINTGNNNGGGGTTDTRKGPPYPFDGSPADPRFSVLPGWVVDNTITSLQAHGVHVSWSQVEALNGGTSRTPPAIWSNIRNNGSGKSAGNFFASGYTYRLPPQTTWYK